MGNSSELWSLATNFDHYRNGFFQQEKNCTPKASDAGIQLLDISMQGKNHDFRETLISTKTELENYLSDPLTSEYSTRVLSVTQKNTWGSLRATSDVLDHIVERYDMMPQVYDLLRCFRDRNLQTEDGFCCPFRMRETKKQLDLCYTYKYSICKDASRSDAWRITQMGVYHQYDKEANRSTWLLIFSYPKCKAQERMRHSLSVNSIRSELASNPMLLHSILISTYLSDWRQYLLFYEKRVISTSDTLATILFDESPSVDHDTLIQLRTLEYRFLPLPTILRTFEEIIEKLELVARNHFKNQTSTECVVSAFYNFKCDIRSFLENSNFLIERTRATCQQMSDTLNFKNQDTTTQQSGYISQLTKAAVDDSATIRVITLVTLFYLPFSFIATVMGMNFFDLDERSRRVIVSPQLWVYFGVSVPLTGLTLAFWKWSTRRRKAQSKSWDGEKGLLKVSSNV